MYLTGCVLDKRKGTEHGLLLTSPLSHLTECLDLLFNNIQLLPLKRMPHELLQPK